MKFTKDTPWGRADSVTDLGAGLFSVGTPSHGGLFVPDDLLERMPFGVRFSNSYSGADSNWFEEDCEWALPVISFPELFDMRMCYYAVRTIGGRIRAKGEYFYSAAEWLASEAGEPARAKGGQYKEAAA